MGRCFIKTCMLRGSLSMKARRLHVSRIGFSGKRLAVWKNPGLHDLLCNSSVFVTLLDGLFRLIRARSSASIDRLTAIVPWVCMVASDAKTKKRQRN